MKQLLARAGSALAVIMAVLAAAPQAPAQCSMCRATLAASSEAAAAVSGWNLGIMVLLVPPVAIFIGIFVTGYRYRNAYNRRQYPDR